MKYSIYGGYKEGLAKFGKIILWYVVSGLVTGAVALLSNYKPESDQVIALMGVMIANALLAGVTKWLTTNTPDVAKKKKK